jgi:hypothetical protein
MASSPPTKPKNDETRVDLGDDLLEATRVLDPSPASGALPRARIHEEISPEKASDDELQSAQILIGEGLWDQAKDALHRSIRHNPSNRVARRLLDQIQQRELETLLARPGVAQPTEVVDEDVAEVVKRLDKDWGLGLEDLDVKSSSLLTSDELRRELATSVSRHIAGLSIRDRADLAVGFLQMEMPEVAVSLLEPGTGLSGGYLAVYCTSLLRADRAFECASHLEVRLRDEELKGDVRRELEYLLARARERLGENELACELFRLLADYRDSATRYRKLQVYLSQKGRD